METIEDLIDGYYRFRADRYPQEERRYRALAQGQSPKIMIIACADSRSDPATIFAAAPGELFVVRNVANLVPPYTPDGTHHATSAALEFAVLGLKVRHIVVMGHARCGGIHACLKAETEAVGFFIRPWVEIAAPARAEVLAEHPNATEDELAGALEHAAIRLSLRNLRTFPCIHSHVRDGTLSLHGAYFGIRDGILHWLDSDTEAFRPITAEAGASS